MSINPLETEVSEVYRQIVEVEARREALSVTLHPIIDRYFSAKIRTEKNPELRRDFAYLNSSKRFELIDEDTIRFTGRNISGPIKQDVKIADLLAEGEAVES